MNDNPVHTAALAAAKRVAPATVGVQEWFPVWPFVVIRTLYFRGYDEQRRETCCVNQNSSGEWSGGTHVANSRCLVG